MFCQLSCLIQGTGWTSSGSCLELCSEMVYMQDLVFLKKCTIWERSLNELRGPGLCHNACPRYLVPDFSTHFAWVAAQLFRKKRRSKFQPRALCLCTLRSPAKLDPLDCTHRTVLLEPLRANNSIRLSLLFEQTKSLWLAELIHLLSQVAQLQERSKWMIYKAHYSGAWLVFLQAGHSLPSSSLGLTTGSLL